MAKTAEELAAEAAAAEAAANGDDGGKGMPPEALNRIARSERLRREKAEKRVKELEELEEQRQREKLSEQERLVKEAYDRGRNEEKGIWEPKLKTLEKRSKLVQLLADRRADTDAVEFIKLDEIETEEDAVVAIDKLLTSKPHLVLAETPEPAYQPGAPRRPVVPKPGPGQTTGNITQSQVKAWTRDPEQYAKHKEEIGTAAREGRIIEG